MDYSDDNFAIVFAAMGVSDIKASGLCYVWGVDILLTNNTIKCIILEWVKCAYVC